VDGVELDCENGLPLGLVPDAKYPECVRRLSSRQQMTVMTDGVLEASNKEGELFGFARTQFMSRQTAEKIAETAQEFGQDDDITVLTLTRSVSTGDVTRPQEC
jgi:serine phosphatase RsbU (regulator of sigma subunit)